MMSPDRFPIWRSARAIAIALVAAVVCPSVPAADDVIVSAREAFRARDKSRLAVLTDRAQGHDLAPYVEYWNLALRLEDLPTAEVGAFLERQHGSVLAERMRGEWLKALGKARQWPEFDREFAKFVSTDQEITCYGWQSRMLRRDATAYDEAKSLWLDAGLPQACNAALELLAAEGKMSNEQLWQRLRRLLEGKSVAPGRSFAAYLPAGEAPDGRTLDSVVSSPAPFIYKLRPDFSSSHTTREMAMVAVARMARSDPQGAARAFEPLAARFTANERGYVYGQLGWQGAMQHSPQAVAWYKAAGDTPMTDEQLAWKARSALRAGDWRQVKEAVEAMPSRLATLPDWVYWRARALATLGKKDEAQTLYRSISGQPNFYSNLAEEELGRTIAVPARASKPTNAEVDAVAALPGVRRALQLFNLNLRWEAVREWNWNMRERDDRFLLAAAEYARRNQIFDRAINTADRTQAEHDFDLRYLSPFRERVEPKAKQVGLDEAWVYGLMRQESRFVMNAKSSVGASGLMQVMPATARWVARKIGLKDYSHSDIHDMDTNVVLGTNYLRMVLDGLGNQPVLAAAAYNAGPGRAKRWRDSRPMEGAIYIESIPFNETRDYVKQVMSNTVYYAALFGAPAVPLKTRIGMVTPGDTNNGVAAPPAGEDELP
ncbi:MAG: transglycosylase SLT domain-containing protein [Rhodocyclaceae bacterium]